MDHTGAALAGVAPYMSACFAKRFADEINEQGIVRHICSDRLTIERKTYIGHASTFSKNSFVQ